jgi:hypothetical protein
MTIKTDAFVRAFKMYSSQASEQTTKQEQNAIMAYSSGKSRFILP